MPTGRFAPSPTGTLHVGNLRTALAARLSASAGGGTFLIRFEDLDPVASRRATADEQLRDLASIGIESDEPPVWQSERLDLYEDALAALTAAGLTYECYCSRREIRDAVAAPHGGEIAYPGTCRDLPDSVRRERATSRRPALRLRTDGSQREVRDMLQGTVTGPVTDIVLRRNDGVPSYNLAVVVDDALQGVTEVVRGHDLLAITPTQVLLQELLGRPAVAYLHVPLVTGPDGERLAKRHGAVGLADLAAAGRSSSWLRRVLVDSLGQSDDQRFDPAAIPRGAWVFDAPPRRADRM